MIKGGYSDSAIKINIFALARMKATKQTRIEVTEQTRIHALTRMETTKQTRIHVLTKIKNLGHQEKYDLRKFNA
ncbi:MAG TPA: hypothetical protein VJ201_06765 [Candidatus Babeliales bacterium]|nr:hypothetical protein [Candidatus Babeliales bacterium]